MSKPEDHLILSGISEMLRSVGIDPSTPGISDTPARVLKAFREMTVGYSVDPGSILKRTFDNDMPDPDQLIVVRGIRFVSMCEHHLMPFSGVAHVAYLPQGNRVVGLSKIPRLVECFSKRMQMQERLTRQITDAIERHLEPRGAGAVIVANHSCMGCRGVRQPDAEMVTSSVTGLLRSNDSLRSEFFDLIGIRGRN
ncbi:FolE GTP cyclohydrolase I [uncultured Caudovirales phage]|uniref:GTP cyclohydrolase I n=1 Tax=uncultured Caudovirales phage TaxID=2100421 RepID=A0A6J5LZ18_9CAUD|nr:FolE GTP cyclohydrolase I [uncultured Caudovirales phage]